MEMEEKFCRKLIEWDISLQSYISQLWEGRWGFEDNNHIMGEGRHSSGLTGFGWEKKIKWDQRKWGEIGMRRQKNKYQRQQPVKRMKKEGGFYIRNKNNGNALILADLLSSSVLSSVHSSHQKKKNNSQKNLLILWGIHIFLAHLLGKICKNFVDFLNKSSTKRKWMMKKIGKWKEIMAEWPLVLGKNYIGQGSMAIGGEDGDIFLLCCRCSLFEKKVFGLFSIFVWAGNGGVAVATASKSRKKNVKGERA
jgi:hypothetical protein